MLRRAAIAMLARLEGAARASQGIRTVLLEQTTITSQAELHAPLLRTARLLPSAAEQLLQQRQYAQAQGPKGSYTPPLLMQRQMGIKNTLVSPNVLAEPYKGAHPKLPFTSWFTISGWKERFNRIMGSVKSIYTVARCKKFIPGWSLPVFKQEALDLYQEVCKQLAEGDRTQLRHLVTPSVFSDMKRQLKQREDGGWARVEWQMTSMPTLRELEVVHGRLVSLDPKDDSTGFAQFTMKIPSKQKFAAYDRKGRLMAGDKEKEIAVEDYWVFEHSLRKQAHSRWRLAARLAIPQPKKLNS